MTASQPLLGRTLGGRFKITSHLGEGAMASVFRGVDLSRQTDIAIKVMHPHLAQDRTFTGRFKREAQAASMIKHANSVAIFDIGEEQGVHFIVMELCPGRDLRETLRIDKRLSEPRAVRIVASVCEALHAAHQLGVVHRDLKPENVMVLYDPSSQRDAVKVLDFGIAKLVDSQPKVRVSGETDSDPPPALTQFGVVVGTPAYMSPEQCRGQSLDGRSDLYTCGILLYQLVTGQVPFDSPSPLETAGKQAFEPPPPPSSILPTINRDLEAIILKTLSKSPAERPQTAMELRETLVGWLDAQGEIERAAPANVDLRALGRTMPMKAMAASVEDFLKQRGIQGPFQPQAAAEVPLAPIAGSRGQLGTTIPNDAPQPAAPVPPMPVPAAPPASVTGQGPPQPLLPDAPAAPDGRYPPPPAPLAAPPHEPEKKGLGLSGCLFLVLAVVAGVAVGVTAFRFLPATLP
jgi:serine/threonine-protein kinase